MADVMYSGLPSSAHRGMQTGVHTGVQTGVLSKGGGAMVHLLISDPAFVHALPQRWQAHVAAVRDNHGELIDWLPVPGLAADEREQFLRLRGAYQQERLIADVATVRAFLRWADRHMDVCVLHVLRLPLGRIEPHDLAKACWQATTAGRLARAEAGGVGVFAAGRPGLLRGFATSTTLIAAADTSCEVRDGQLWVTSGSVHELPVSGWVTDAEGVQLTGLDGSSVHADRRLARLLETVSMGTRAVDVRSISLGQVFAGITSGVAEMARLAESRQRPLLINSGLPVIDSQAPVPS
jgi:hypothetical protein